jgi:hypothetical protein
MLTRDLIQTFLISTVINTFADKEESRSWPMKVARAAILSVPATVVVNTDKIVEKVAERFPSLGISEKTERPKSVQDMAQQVEDKMSNTKLKIIAYYSKPIDQEL